MLGTTILLALAVVVAIALLRSIRRVPAGHVMVVERLGRYLATFEPGTHLLVPVVDAPRALHSTAARTIGYPPRSFATADGAELTLASELTVTVVDPVRATYQVHDLGHELERIVTTALATLVGARPEREVHGATVELARQARSVLADATAPWGLRVEQFEVTAPEAARATASAIPRGPFID